MASKSFVHFWSFLYGGLHFSLALLLTNICVDEVPAPRSRPTTVRQGNGGLKALKTSKHDWSPEVKIFFFPHTRAVGACVWIHTHALDPHARLEITNARSGNDAIVLSL